MPFPIAPHALTLTASSWNTIASGLPPTSNGSAVVGAIVRVVRTGTAGEIVFGVRRGDSTDTLQSTYGSPSIPWQQEVYIGVDSSQNIGVYVNTISNVTVYVVGGFTAAEAVFLQNAALETATAGSPGYVTQILPGAIYGSDVPQAVFLYPTSTSPAVFRGARQTGSTDAWLFATNAFPIGLLIGLQNNSGVFNFDWYYTAGTTKYRVVGYIKSGLAWNTNSTVVTPATAAAYTDITSGGLVAGAVAALYGLQGSSANESMAIAASTTPTPDLYEPANIDHLGFMMGFVDGSQKVYAKLSALTAAVRLLGVFTGGGGTTTPTITNVAGTAYLGNCIITGTGLNQGTLTAVMGGVNQPVVVNSPTQATIATLQRSDGVNQCGYGTLQLIVTSSTAGSSAGFPVAFGPQAGGQYVTLGTLDPTAAYRATAIPDLAPGMLLAAYGITGTGALTLDTDGTWVADSGVTGAFFEAFSGTAWGTAAFQAIAAITPPSLPPVIATQPTPQTAAQGATATFAATCTGSGSITWQAYDNTAAVGPPGTGTSASFTTPPVDYAIDNGSQIGFVFTNAAGSTPTNNATLTVIPISVTVPNIVGMTGAAAIAALAAANATVGAVTSANSTTIDVGLVISQNPAAEFVGNFPVSVDYVLSLGPYIPTPTPPTMEVPSVLGLTQAQAQSFLTSVGLGIGSSQSFYG